MARRSHRQRRYRSYRDEERARGADPRPPKPPRAGQADPDPGRLYRDRERGMIAGVCAGIADYFGFSLTGTRIATVILAIVLLPWVLLAYVILAVVLPTKPRPFYRDEEEERFWRSVRRSPISTLSQVRHRFREMEARMQRLERYVTSSHFRLDRDFRELEK
jgi:phage shock protein C